MTKIKKMKTKILQTVAALLLMINAPGQSTAFELTFTAIDSATYTQLDSIKVMNLTHESDTTLYWPDTTLVLDYPVGIAETNQNNSTLQLFQNYPNPVIEFTTISLRIPEEDVVNLRITDALGRDIINNSRILHDGEHRFRFHPGNGKVYFFTAQYRGESSSIKILRANTHLSGECSLEYLGGGETSPYRKHTVDNKSFIFNLGDELLLIGYHDTLQSGMLTTPVTSEAFTFQFAINIPCVGTPVVHYEGRSYTTIQIFNQCWLKENLNIGNMIKGVFEMTDNGILEKYCYNNDTNKCATYGGLYQWNEMMQYATEDGAQGICPPGWHIPRDEEWKILEGSADSNFDVGDLEWNLYGLRGYDAGKRLKTTSGWYNYGDGTDVFDFSGLPGGYRYSNGQFQYLRRHALWWSSTEGNSTSAWNRYLSFNNQKVDRDFGDNKKFAFSIRCIRDN
jgi:uncharacterized protein (TIGR02145 family)